MIEVRAEYSLTETTNSSRVTIPIDDKKIYIESLQNESPCLIPDFLRMVSKCGHCTLFDRCPHVYDMRVAGKKLANCFRIDIYPQSSDIDEIIKLLDIKTKIICKSSKQ